MGAPQTHPLPLSKMKVVRLRPPPCTSALVKFLVVLVCYLASSRDGGGNTLSLTTSDLVLLYCYPLPLLRALAPARLFVGRRCHVYVSVYILYLSINVYKCDIAD